MRVLMTCPYSLSRPGGVQGQVMGLARELRRLGVDVRIIAPCDGPPPAPGIISVGPSVEWENNGSIAPIATGGAMARRTIAAIRSHDPQIVHLHEPLVPGPSLSALLGFQGPMVGTFHISGEVPHLWLRPALRSVMTRLDVRVAVSEAACTTATTNYEGDYEVLWNGIDVARFAQATPCPSFVPAVLFVGRHESRKGLGVLLSAWSDVQRSATLWVVGSGPETEELKSRQVGGVEWLGRLDDDSLAARMSGATIFCAPSLGGESFGVVLLEAMAAGTTVVASGIGGYTDVARDGHEAVLVPPTDPEALREALRRVLDDPVQRSKLVTAGRARAESFSMERLARSYRDLYDQVLTRRGRIEGEARSTSGRVRGEDNSAGLRGLTRRGRESRSSGKGHHGISE